MTTADTATGRDAGGDTETADGAATLSAIRDRAEAIRERELTEALSKLEARGGLDPSRRAAVEAMTENLVDALLASPAETLRDAEDPETRTVARDVFDPDG